MRLWFKQQRAERLATQRPTRKKPKRKRKHGRRDQAQWAWDGLVVSAFTKSEARAKFKAIRELKRIPTGSEVERVE